MNHIKNLIGDADLIVADGMPIVWAANSLNKSNRMNGRTTGVGLVEGLFLKEKVPQFGVIGGVNPSESLNRYPIARKKCRYIFDGKVALDDASINAFVDDIKSSGAKIILLALGVPKQDLLAVKLRKLLPGVLFIGVGGTMEILGSADNRAPQWMQNSGLEWLFRLLREPKRLWKRYLLRYPVGIKWLISDVIKQKRKLD